MRRELAAPPACGLIGADEQRLVSDDMKTGWHSCRPVFMSS